MTTRDPRSRNQPTPTSPGDGGVREPTQSMNVAPDEQGEPSALAVGTHNRPVTRRDSPASRSKTSGLHSLGVARVDDPTAYVDAVLGSYRVIDLLGKGGMGYVFRAEHVLLGREVALK